MDSRLSLCLSLPSAGIRVVSDPRVVFVSSDDLLDCLAVPGAGIPQDAVWGATAHAKRLSVGKEGTEVKDKGAHKPGTLFFLYQASGAILVTLFSDMAYTTSGNEVKRSEGWRRRLSHGKFQPHVARPWCCGRGSPARSEGSTRLIEESLSF